MADKIFENENINPLAIFKDWLAEARQSEINDPEAMALATCNAAGQPSLRMVLLKDLDDRGFKFHTNANSQKGQEILENPKAALCFYWKSLRKQVRVEGIISMAGEDEADAYFRDRPRARQVGAWASQQSSMLDSRETLERKIAEFDKKFDGQNVPRPGYWKGYILKPERIEFWMDNPDRLHDRFLFVRQKNGGWAKAQRLYP